MSPVHHATYLDARGCVMPRQWVEMREELRLVVDVSVAGLLVASASLFFGGVGAVGAIVWTARELRLRWLSRVLTRAELMLRRGDEEMAYAIACEVATDPLSVVSQRSVACQLAIAACLAMGRADEAQRRAKMFLRTFVEQDDTSAISMVQLQLAQALISLGRFEEAREVLRTVKICRDATQLRMLWLTQRLHVSFLCDERAPQPVDLHDWIDQALSAGNAPELLALLAWCCEGRGDEEMAAHLRGAALDIWRPRHSRRYGTLHHWLGARPASLSADIGLTSDSVDEVPDTLPDLFLAA